MYIYLRLLPSSVIYSVQLILIAPFSSLSSSESDLEQEV